MFKNGRNNGGIRFFITKYEKNLFSTIDVCMYNCR